MLVVWWLWLPVIGGGFLWWMAYGPFFSPDGYEWPHHAILYIKMTMLHGAYMWLYVALGLIGTVLILLFMMNEVDHDKRTRKTQIEGISYVVGALVSVIAVVVTLAWPYATTLWDNDKDMGRYYANSTAFYVDNPANVPDSLKYLADGASKNTEGCALLGVHDVRGCVRQGTLSADGWDARVSSLEGATIAIRRKTSGVTRVSLAEQTVTYLNGSGATPAVWSGVLDGSGKEQPLYGVAEWDGKNDPKICQFTGKYGLTRAFSGERGNSLSNKLAETYPDMHWDMSDVWGYCDGDKPVVVVPMTKPVTWMHRTVDTAAGVVLVEGDNGKLKTTYVADVKPGSFRGPVYPQSIVATQRDMTKWAAGRKSMNRYGFGYDASNSEAQAGNAAEYLLRDKKSGRLVYVTPLTLRSSTSEVFVAYSVTYADEVRAGNLNELSVYVLGHDDARLINIDQLAAEANDWMSRNAGMFKSNGGKLIEFTPIDGDTWRVFGEMGGNVVYQLDVSASHKVAPTLVSLDAYSSAQTVPGASAPAGTTCKAELSSLDNASLSSCLKSVTDEVQKRLSPAQK